MARSSLPTAVLSLALVALAGTSHAGTLVYVANLNGPSESPPNTAPGTGSAEVIIDPVAHTMRVEVAFSGLTSGTTASHIHAATPAPGTGTAPVATTTPTFPNSPLGVTSGTYDQTFDMTMLSSYNPAFVTANGGTAAGAEAALFAAMAADEAYLNIHTTQSPSGEIRGFLHLASVPEPSGLVLLGVGSLALIAFGRGQMARRRKRSR